MDLRPAIEKLLGRAAVVRKIGEVNHALTVAAAAVADAHAERDHWRKAYAEVQTEMRLLVGILSRRMGGRIIIREAELDTLPGNAEVHVGNPEPGVRVYEFREGRKETVQ